MPRCASCPERELAEIEAFLRRTGYGLDMLVDEPGEAAVHGHVVDVFPAGALGPVRIEHEDGRVTRIDSYDPATQRTSDELPEIVLDAASEFVAADATEQAEGDDSGAPPSPWLSAHYPSLDTLFDYLPDAKVLIEDREVEQRAALWFEQIREAHEGARLLPAAAEVGGAVPVPGAPLSVRGGMGSGAARSGAARAGAAGGTGDAVRDRAQSGERLSRVYRRTARSRTARRPRGGRRTRL